MSTYQNGYQGNQAGFGGNFWQEAPFQLPLENRAILELLKLIHSGEIAQAKHQLDQEVAADRWILGVLTHLQRKEQEAARLELQWASQKSRVALDILRMVQAGDLARADQLHRQAAELQRWRTSLPLQKGGETTQPGHAATPRDLETTSAVAAPLFSYTPTDRRGRRRISGQVHQNRTRKASPLFPCCPVSRGPVDSASLAWSAAASPLPLPTHRQARARLLNPPSCRGRQPHVGHEQAGSSFRVHFASIFCASAAKSPGLPLNRPVFVQYSQK